MPEALSNLGITLALCYAAWGFFYGVLHRRGIDYSQYYGWTTLYFVAVALGLAFIFWNTLAPVLQNYSPTPLVVLGSVMFLQLVAYVLVPKYLQGPRDYFEMYPNRQYLKIDWRRLIPKSADILAQQVFIVLLVLFLRDVGLSFYEIVFYFGILFAFLHIPLLVLEWRRWPMFLFSGAVIGFSLVFPYLILYVPYGFAYNIIIHWLFYTVMAVVFWVYHARTQHSRQKAD